MRILEEPHVTWKSHGKSYSTRETNRRSDRERQDRKPGQSITDNQGKKDKPWLVATTMCSLTLLENQWASAICNFSEPAARASPHVGSHIALTHRISSKRESSRSLCGYRVKKGVPCAKSHPILGNVRGAGRNIQWRNSSRHLNSRFLIGQKLFSTDTEGSPVLVSTDSKDARPRVVPFILLALLRFHQQN